MNLTDFPRAN